jgi:hypothetical protein
VGTHPFELAGSRLPAGLYFLRITQAGRSAVGKLVVF